MESKKHYRLIDYAKFVGVSPAAVTKMINTKRVKVVLVDGKRLIEA